MLVYFHNKLHQLHDLLQRGHSDLHRARDMRPLARVLAHVEVTARRGVEEVLAALVVDLDVRERELPAHVVRGARDLEEVVDGARHHTGRLPAARAASFAS